MAVKHILKDGTVVQDIKGHVVKIEDAQSFYMLLDKLNERKRKEKTND